MNLDALSRLIRQPRFLARGVQAVLGAVPELVDGAPVLSLAGDGVAIPSSVGPALADRVSKAIAAAVKQAIAGRSPPLDRGDPVVAALVTLMTEGLHLSPAAGVVPLLQVVRESVSALTHPNRELEADLATVRGLPVEAQGLAWMRIAAAIQGRVGLCCAEVAGGGLRVPALAQAILGCRLALLFPLGTIDAAAQLPILLGVTGNPLPCAAGQASVIALRTLLTGVLERKAKKKSTPDDEVLLLGPLRPEVAELGVEGALRRVLGDAGALTQLISAFPRLLDAKTLTRAGVPDADARSILGPVGAAAAISGLTQLSHELGRWEVIAALAQALQPVDVRGRADRALLVPHRPVKLAVVVVGLGPLRSAGADRGSSPPAVERSWREVVRLAPGAAACDTGSAGILLFEEVGMAVRVALRIADRFVTTGARPAVAISWGTVLGGTDGEITRVSGPAIDAALHWLATPGAPLVPGRRVGVQNGWLVGDGVAIHESAATLVSSLWSGPTTIPAAAPAALEMVAAFEGDQETLAFARIADRTGGYELLCYSPVDWDAMVRPLIHGPVRVGVGVPSAPTPHPTAPSVYADSDPFADELMEADDDPDSENLDGPVFVGPPVAAAIATPPSGDPFATTTAPPPPEPEDPLADFLHDLKQAPPPTEADAHPTAAVHYRPMVLALGAPTPVAATIPLGATSFETLPDLLAADEEEPEDEGFKEVDPLEQEFSGFYLPGVTSTAQTPTPGSRVTSSPAGPMRPSAGTAVVEDEPTDETPRGPHPDPSATISALPELPAAREPVIDFGFVLTGYVVYRDAGRVVFGRPYGRRLVDSHTYDTGGDLHRAYPQFLADKIAEGFVPRTDLTSDLPATASPAPLDEEQLSAAWRALA